MNKILTTIILLLSVLPSVGTAQIFGPNNYEDCIIEGMQGVASDVAAVAVRSACREKFPITRTTPALGSGWQVNSEGIGVCNVAWDGEGFTARPENEAYDGLGYSTLSIMSPKNILVAATIPKPIMERLESLDGETDRDKVITFLLENKYSIERSCDYRDIF